jgi:hypothetical protein
MKVSNISCAELWGMMRVLSDAFVLGGNLPQLFSHDKA